MPNYDLRCEYCGLDYEEFFHLSEWERNGFTGVCPRCTGTSRQVFRACNIIGDELGKTVYLDPDSHKMVQSHGRVYDEGMGEWYETKSERRRLMKAKGLKEYGGSDPHGLSDKGYEQYYKKVQEEKRSWHSPS